MHVTIKIQDLKDADKTLFPELKDKFIEGQVESVGILQGGMESGKASLCLNIKLDDDTYVIAQLSAGMIESISAAVRGAQQRWDES